MRAAVGIDLGTTRSSIAVYRTSGSQVAGGPDGRTGLPSIVAFPRDGGVVVGDPARPQMVADPRRTVRRFKRHMGTGWTAKVAGRLLSPQQLTEYVIRELVAKAAGLVGEPITEAVIGVPACFNETQRQATRTAAELAGLQTLRLINEPTAAVLDQCLADDRDRMILVFDLGGGKLDCSLVESGDGVLEVKATSGNPRLGGADWDLRIVEWLAERLRQSCGVDPTNDIVAMERLVVEAEWAKIELSTHASVIIRPAVFSDEAINLRVTDEILERDEFQQFTTDLLHQCLHPVRQVLTDAGLTASDVDLVFLVGGSTRMPAVADLLRAELGDTEFLASKHLDYAVAVGAAIEAGVLRGDVSDILVLDVLPFSVGLESAGGVFTQMIERNTSIPTARAEIFTTAKDNQTSIAVTLFQGEGAMVADNVLLGRYEFSGVPPAARGVPQIEVTVSVDANGVVSASARDLAAGTNLPLTLIAPRRDTPNRV